MPLRHSLLLAAVLAPALVVFGGCRANLPTTGTPAMVTPTGPGSIADPMSVYDPRWTTTPEQLAQPATSRVALRRAVGPTWSGSAQVDVFSRYVWRGALALDDPVLQPAATVAYGGLSLNVWGNLDLGDANGTAGELTEVDITLDYTHQVSDGAVPASVSFGAIWYTSPSGWFDDIAEIYAGVSADVFLQPSFKVYVGVHGPYEGDGVFMALDLAHSVPLGCGSLELGTGIGWGNHHFNGALFGAPEDALGELYLQAGWAYARGRWTLTPSVKFSSLLDGSLRDAQGKNDLFIFGLSAAVDF